LFAFFLALVEPVEPVDVFVVDVFDAGVDDEESPLSFDPLPPDPLTIARNAMTTTISARGPRNRAGVFLVR
jgi:hypothetical protein